AGIDWAAPSIPEFVLDVVAPIEAGATEMEITAISAFRDFLAMFRVEHTVRKTSVYEHGGGIEESDSVKGEGTIMLDSGIDVNEGRDGLAPKRIAGDWVRAPVLDRYNAEQDRRSRPELRFGSLKELSECAAREAGLPGEAFLRYDKGRGLWKPRQPQFNDGSRKSAAFVPREEGLIDGVLEGTAWASTTGPPLVQSRLENDTENGDFSDVESSGTRGSRQVPVGHAGSLQVPAGPGQVPEASTEVKTAPGPPLRDPGTRSGAPPTVVRRSP
ncbi:MAG: hypothetical protein WA688_09355, partial [Thermoplasmata archaeon]